MRTLISTAFVSLDGVVEAPGGEPGYRNSGWTFKNMEFLPEAYDIKGREQQEATAMLLGRTSYQAFSPVWPGMEDFSSYKEMPKYVVSTTLTDDDLVSDWGRTTILRSLDEVAAPKEDARAVPIIMHGIREAPVEVRHRLIPEPLGLLQAGDLIERPPACLPAPAVGAGKRLFSDTDKDMQKLESRRARGLRQRSAEASSTSSADNSRAWSTSTARGHRAAARAPEARGAPQVPGRLGGQPVTAMSSGPFVNRPPVSLRRPARPSGAVRGKSGSPSSLMSEARARATRERTVPTGQLRARAASA